MDIQTDRLTISQLNQTMVESIHRNSLDSDNRRFLPDEVFETLDDASNAVNYLLDCYLNPDGPFVYPVFTLGIHIGHIQVSKIQQGWEVGYHIAEQYTRKGYATEALSAFVPVIMRRLEIDKVFGICHQSNTASRRVLEKSGFTLKEVSNGDSKEEAKLVYEFRLQAFFR